METFDKILEFLRSITFPRATGTEGDQQAQTLIKEAFSRIPRAEMEDQEFTISHIYMSGILNIIHPLIGLLMLLNFSLITFHLYIGAFILSVILLGVTILNRQIIWALQFRVQQLGSQIPAKNMWVSFNPTNENKQNIVFLVHYDSISHSLSPILEALGYLAGFVGGTLFAIHCIIYLVPIVFLSYSAASFVQLLWGIPVASLTLIELFNKKGNDSDGAMDNAAAVAQGYHLALSVSRTPLENIRLIICATGAEEWGDYGAYYFIKENPCVLSPENTRFFIVDGIGTAEKTLILYGIGLPVRHWSLFLEKHARELIEESGVPFVMRTIPPLLQVASDHVPVENAGFEFIWFASNSFIFHSPKDNINALNEENFRVVCEFLDKFVRKIDKSV